MTSQQRIFVDAITRYCAARGIAVDVRAQGWLIVMERGPRRHFAFGYDIGLNSAIAHRLANDKSATAEVLAMSGLACVPHTLFLSPKLGARIAPDGSRATMRELLRAHPDGIVVKPNEGTSGRFVFKATDETELTHAVDEIFSAYLALAISPYVAIEEEVRVVLLDHVPMVVYGKQRVSDWRHNLDFGARPVLLESGDARESCVELAIKAAKAIGIRFAAIDIIRSEDGWKVLEINSGVMMETLGRHHPELVHGTYGAALDRVFG